MSGFNHFLEATLTPGRNRVLKKKGSLSHSLSIRLMVSLSIKHLANEPLSGLLDKRLMKVARSRPEDGISIAVHILQER